MAGDGELRDDENVNMFTAASIILSFNKRREKNSWALF